MCGIVGFMNFHSNAEIKPLLSAMAAAIEHRGPDDVGVWDDPTHGLGLGHRRLSILDLSPAGHQPMTSASGRYTLVFNGEIYNHLDLRKALGEQSWRGHSDTETLLAAFEHWGLEETLKKTVGMFAIAAWDRESATLNLARDRIGEKPLYYGWQNGVFLFGSELKALQKHPSFEGKINRNALTLLLRHNYIPSPHSIYEGIYKLSPGTLLKLPHGVKAHNPQPTEYWSVSEAVKQGQSTLCSVFEAEAVEELERLLREAVALQMVADVPLGAFLSGGIDSSTIVALMQAQSSRPVKTFTIGFNEEGYNEAVHAKAVAHHLGTEHTELYVTPEQALDVIPRLPHLYDEPFSDSSQIPTFLVSQLTRQHVTVSLSGDAGDELFGGYNRYVLAHNLWRKIALMPRAGRRLIAKALTAMSPQTWNMLLSPFQKLTPASLRLANLGDKLHKGAAVLSSNDIDAVYLKLISHWDDPASVVLGAEEPSTLLNGNTHPFAGLGDIQRMMALDAMTYLPDDILVKVDRAAMGVSLETRVPMLDHRVVEFAWRLPLPMKIRNGQGKWVLRQVLYKYVPKELIERPKMGFGVPIDSWLRGPLRDWAEDLLDESRMKQEGFFDPKPIREKWLEHLSGGRNWQYYLWDVLMFQAWLKR